MDPFLSAENKIGAYPVILAALYYDLINIIDQSIIIKYTIFSKSQVLIISSENYSCPSRTVGNHIVMYIDSRYFEQFIIIRAVFSGDFHSDIAVENKIVVYLNILTAVYINASGAEVVFPVLVIHFIALSTDIIDKIIPADSVSYIIRIIWVYPAGLVLMKRHPFKADHVDPDVVVIMDLVSLDQESVYIAVDDHRFAPVALTVVYLTPLDRKVCNRCQVVARINTNAMFSADIVNSAVPDTDVA